MGRKAITKKALLDALKKSNFEVEISEPNNVELCTKYDGTKFLLIRGDTERFGASYGECTVTILGHSFTCDLDNGEWSASEDDDSKLLEDDVIIEALESADGVISGEQGDVDAQRKVFCRANSISEDIEAYWVEDDDIPKDINNLDWCDPVSAPVMVISEDGKTEEVECDMECDSIYQLYRFLQVKGKLYKTPTVSSAFIQKEVPKLHNEILEELKFNLVISDDTTDVNYSLANTKEFFELILG